MRNVTEETNENEYSELFSTLEKVVLRVEEFMEVIDNEEVDECEKSEE